MQKENEMSAAIDYTGPGKTRARKANQDRGRAVPTVRPEPTVLVEIVVIAGPEGQKLHSVQAEVIHRILTRLAERQTQTSQDERRL